VWTNYISFWDDFLDPLEVTFDGDNKLIIVNPIRTFANGAPQSNTTNIRVKEDIYSASKRWLKRRQNLEYQPPMRAIGGDVVPGGLFAGDIYFLKDYQGGESPGNWRILVDHQVELRGAIYNDATATLPFIVQSGGGVISTTSSLTYSYTGLAASVPTAASIRDEVWGTTPTAYSQGSMAKIVDNTNKVVANVKVVADNIFAVTV
jgi:hypothetical protein